MTNGSLWKKIETKIDGRRFRFPLSAFRFSLPGLGHAPLPSSGCGFRPPLALIADYGPVTA